MNQYKHKSKSFPSPDVSGTFRTYYTAAGYHLYESLYKLLHYFHSLLRAESGGWHPQTARGRYSGILCILVLMTVLTCGCGITPLKKKLVVIPEPERPQASQQTVSDLLIQADHSARIKHYSEALHIYDQALVLASPEAKKQILDQIDQMLASAGSADLEKVLDRPYKQIPRSLLFYSMGTALLAENRHVEGALFLRKVLAVQPFSSHADQARQLLDTLEDDHFSQNTVGCLLPLSGKYALFGQQALQGIQLAIQNISQQHNVSFTMIIRDTQGEPERAAACVDELAAESVMGIIGPLVTARKAGERAQQLGIPMIALTQKTDFLSKGNFLFSNFITPSMQVQSLARYVFQTLKCDTAGILYPEEPYGKTFMNLFWDAFVQYGGKITGLRSYDGTLTDFSKPMEKLTGSYFQLPSHLSQPDQPEKEEPRNSLEESLSEAEKTPDFQVLFIPDGPSRLTLLLPQLTFNDITNIVLVGTNLWHDPALIPEISRYRGKTVISDGYFGNSSRSEVQEFNQNFKQLFQSEPGFLEAAAYDTAQIFFEASRDKATNSRRNLKDILQSGKIFHGITGDTYFNGAGIAQKTLFLLTVKKGQFVELSQGPLAKGTVFQERLFPEKEPESIDTE